MPKTRTKSRSSLSYEKQIQKLRDLRRKTLRQVFEQIDHSDPKTKDRIVALVDEFYEPERATEILNAIYSPAKRPDTNPS